MKKRKSISVARKEVCEKISIKKNLFFQFPIFRGLYFTKKYLDEQEALYKQKKLALSPPASPLIFETPVERSLDFDEAEKNMELAEKFLDEEDRYWENYLEEHVDKEKIVADVDMESPASPDLCAPHYVKILKVFK